MTMINKEWIGSEVSVAKAANALLVGISGIAVDETESFVRLETARGVRSIPKRAATFLVAGEMIEGSRVALSPVERTRMKVM